MVTSRIAVVHDLGAFADDVLAKKPHQHRDFVGDEASSAARTRTE